MRIFVVDDENPARSYLVNMIKKVEPDAEIQDFGLAKDVLEAIETTPYDVVFLDIQMPGITGIELAKKLKAHNPQSNIIFVTGYSEYTLDAFSVDASSYLLKPASADQIRHALDNLRYPITVTNGPDITVQCFGSFEIFYKGEPIQFKYSKSKEVVAYLIDRKGAMVTNNEVIINVWDDDEDHRNYYRGIMKDIQDTFTALGQKDLLIRKRANAGINKNLLRCDYYDFLEGTPAGLNAYQGEYMIQYSWAEETAGALFDEFDY